MSTPSKSASAAVLDFAALALKVLMYASFFFRARLNFLNNLFLKPVSEHY
jgi:hypothetical protein